MPPVRLGPKKAISILPSRKISITPGKEGKLLPEGSKFTVYGKKKPKLLPTKFAGKAKTGPTAAVNRYMERGGRKIISKVYSKNYNVVRSESHWRHDLSLLLKMCSNSSLSWLIFLSAHSMSSRHWGQTLHISFSFICFQISV